MNVPNTSVLARCVASLLLLSGCAGGGGVHENIAPASLPPPPPSPVPPPTTVLCPPPLTTDCFVDPPYTLTYLENEMTGGRQSDHKLVVWGDGGGWLNLKDGTYRFSGGTDLAGNLIVWDTLESDVRISSAAFSAQGNLWLIGTVRGDVQNDGILSWQTACYPGGACAPTMTARIEGDYQQSWAGTMNAVLGWTLQITGTAKLDGSLELYPQRLEGGGYLLPDIATPVHILHTGEGVSGTFATWRGMGVFVEGNLRYTTNDVFLDATRLSLQTAMANSATITPASLQVAERLDRSFEDADDFALQEPHTLDDAQRAFLASAASIQHIGDFAQAQRTLDSLGGQAHLVASQMLDGQFAGNAARLRDRLDEQSPTGTTSAWVDTLADSARDRGSFTTNGVFAGLDTWLSPDTLVGGAIASAHSTMQLEATADEARGTTPAAYAYVHHRNAGWYATGLIGVADTSLRVQRTIDLGPGGLHQAQSQRHLSQSRVEGEIGRNLSVGKNTLVSYFGVDYERRRSDAFAEQGGTRLELLAESSIAEQWSASAGLRLSRDWQFGRSGWLRVDVDAGYRRRIAGGDAGGSAAFAGTPGVVFEFGAGPEQAMEAGTMTLGLSGGFHRRWTWMLDYERRTGAVLPGAEWFLGARRNF